LVYLTFKQLFAAVIHFCPGYFSIFSMGAVPVSIAPIHGSKVTEMFLCHIINDQQIPQAFRSFHFEVATCAGKKT